MSQILQIVRGLPLSGKSTWSIQWLAKDPSNRSRINRDDIRFQNFGAYVLPGDLEKLVTKIELANLEILLKAGKSVVVDNQNLRAEYVIPMLELAAKYNVTVLHKDFSITFKEAIARNEKRDRKLPEGVLKKLYNRHQSIPPFPTLNDKSEDFMPYVADESLPTAVLVDVDGTAMKISPERGPFDWEKVILDSPNKPVVEVVKLLKKAGHKVIIVSGRDGVAEQDTRDSLIEAGVEFDEFYIRPAGDRRPDWKVKGEIFNTHIRHRFNVLFCLDDRDQVVDFYRKVLGLTVFQVDYGNF